ncbi:MAG: CCA tRNA nucleotidyltransferase [Candidatus Protochlamydia sp.]|nr:CCA tRNA nucleotidyltransferase [Candidatus Protochlamydia sp.]
MDSFNQAKSIVSTLNKAGFIAYFAGGWVRDYVMGHPSEDIDIATNASPQEIMHLFPNTILVGLAFGVVIVVKEGHQFEVATFRKDLGYEDGRHPTGIVQSTPQEDALRRDFTINGMFYDPLEEVIHDYVHGREDIQRAIIRTIGNPYDRFFEDRLRMLRAFRFSARFGFTIEPETQQAIMENAEKLFPSVAMERVWQEFNKMAAYKSFDQALVEMHRSTLLDVIFPEIIGMHIKDLRHSVASFAHFPAGCPTILYLIALLPTIALDQKIEIVKRLKASKKDMKLVEYVEHLKVLLMKEAEPYEWAKFFADPFWQLALKWIAAPFSAPEREAFLYEKIKYMESLSPHVQRIRDNVPLITAAHLQKEGVLPGRQMGLIMKVAEKMAVNSNFNEAEALMIALKQSPLWKT